jgi:hypothetical protein
MISKPTLPPKAAYVEVEVNGVRQYKKVESAQGFESQISALESANKTLTAQLTAAIQSNSILEDCLIEMAGIVYA